MCHHPVLKGAGKTADAIKTKGKSMTINKGGKGQGNGGGWPSGTGRPSGGGRSNG
jgi:hypothetical protein